MRDYARVSPRTWTGETGRKLRGRKNERILWDYIQTCPTSTMIGLFYLPFPVIGHETGLTDAEVNSALAWLRDEGSAFYDRHQELMWVPTMATWQIAERLKLHDKKIEGIRRELVTFKGHPFARDFVRLYNERFSLEITSDGVDAAIGAPSIPRPEPQAVTGDAGLSPSQGASKGLPVAPDGASEGHRSGSGSGSGSSTRTGEATAPPASTVTDGSWSGIDWLAAFKRSWPDLHPTKAPFYGSPSDTQKGIVPLDDFLATLPREERLRLQARAQDLFAAWAAVDDPAVAKAGHIFAFFVGRLGGLIANLPPPAGAAPPRRRNPPPPTDVAGADEIRRIRSGAVAT